MLSNTEQLMWELSVRGSPSESSGTVVATSRIFLNPAEEQGLRKIWQQKCCVRIVEKLLSEISFVMRNGQFHTLVYQPQCEGVVLGFQ